MKRVSIFPIRDVSFNAESVERLETWLRHYGERVAVPTRRIHAYLEDARAGRYFAGCDALWPVMMGSGTPILQSFMVGRTVYLHESTELLSHWEERYERATASFKEACELGDVAVDVEEHFVGHAEMQRLLQMGEHVVTLSHFAVENQRRLVELKRLFELEDAVSLRRKDPSLGSLLEPAVEAMKAQLSRGGHLLIAASSSVKAERLRELFREHRLDIPVVAKVPEALLQGRWERERWSGLTRATLEESFIDVERDLMVLHDGLFFERAARTAKKRRAVSKDGLQDLKTLSHGDPIIHVEHGIGRYQGLKRLNAGGVPGDYVQLEYADGDKLYLPIYRLNLLQLYRGPSDKARLDKLGGVRWEKVRKKLKMR